MIRVEKVELFELRLPLREPFRISSGIEYERRIFLLRLTDASGATGWSECVAGSAPNYSPETIDTCWLVIRDWIAPRVLHQAFEDPRAVLSHLALTIRGHNMAKAAVEMGIWVLASLIEGLPLAVLLGGTRERVGTGISIGIQESPARLVDRARQAFSEGYQKIKLKVKPGADVDFVAAVREALGPEAHLMVDANNAYTLADVAALQGLDAFDLIMIEQPLAWDDVRQHAVLQKLMRTPICLDESITNRDRAQEMIDLGAGRIINIKPGRVGGFAESLAIHDLAMEHEIPVWCGGMLESGVGRAYNVALASLPNFQIPGDVSPSARYWERDIVSPEWTMDASGHIAVPRTAPGLGVEVDEEMIESLAVRRETLSG